MDIIAFFAVEEFVDFVDIPRLSYTELDAPSFTSGGKMSLPLSSGGVTAPSIAGSLSPITPFIGRVHFFFNVRKIPINPLVPGLPCLTPGHTLDWTCVMGLSVFKSKTDIL